MDHGLVFNRVSKNYKNKMVYLRWKNIESIDF